MYGLNTVWHWDICYCSNSLCGSNDQRAFPVTYNAMNFQILPMFAPYGNALGPKV
jgi:hypothetical protein